MAENNPFDFYDEAAPTLTASGAAYEDDNPFSAWDAEQPPQPAAPASQPPAPPTPVQDMPGVSVVDDAEMQDFLTHFNAANQREGTDKLNESRGRDFMGKLTTVLQYEAELIKGVPSGAVSGVGTALSGAGAVKAGAEANAGEFQRRQIGVFDRIDRGDPVADMDDPVGYQHMTPAQRQLARAQLERAVAGYVPTPVQQQGLYKAGSALKEHAKTILPAAPGYEEVWTRQIGEGLGSMAVGLPIALVGGSGAAGLLYGSMGAGEATERAIEYDRKEKAAGRPGLTQDDIIRSALWGVGPGTTDLLPVEMLLGRLKVPPALAKIGAKTIGRIGGQAFMRMAQQAVVEGSQEGFQQFLQNLIESRYNAEQKFGEDILPNTAVGAGVGGVAQAGKEMAQLALRRFAGRRGSGSPAPQAAGSPDQALNSGPEALSKAPEAASQPTKAPSSPPDAAPAPTIQRDAAPETRAATREQFNQYLALEERLAVIPDDVDAPPELINEAIDAEEAMVETFRATGLPGDSLARGTRQINSMDDVRRAFDEATPEEINEFWQGKAVGPAASGAVVGAGEATQTASAPSAAGAQAKAESAGATASTLRLEKYHEREDGEIIYDAMIEDVSHAQIALKLHPEDKSIEILNIGNDRGANSLKSAFVRKIRDALAAEFPQYETVFGQRITGARAQHGDFSTRAKAPLRPRDLTTDFLRLIAGPAPREQWAPALGVSEDELMPHVERAIASGLLRVDRNGVVRRNASAVAEMEPEVEAEGQKIEQAIESGAGPLLAPGIIEGENVTLTPKAIDKIGELQAIAEEAVAKILPRDVRIEVVDNIAIDRLAHEDNLLSLRSSKSAKVSEGTEGESDETELPGDSEGSGQASDDASRSSDAGAIAAAVGGGGASGADAGEGRILRQESATLRADGSIRTGRLSTAARTAVPGGGDAEALQPVGASEFFEAPGLRGVVTAMPVADHAGLARRGAPASEYRLANLTYRLYAADAPITEPQLKNFQPNFRGGGDFHAPLIWARVSQHMDGTWEVSMVQRIAGAEAPKGMGSKLYAAIEKDLGIRMSPSGILSKEGLAMWRKRSPESVKWHQWSKSENYFISPRRIKDNLARIGMDLADIAARPDTDPNKAEDHAIALAERKELIKLWSKLPLEARGATPNTMFSLRAYHGSPHDFDRFDLGKVGTGEGAQVFGHGLYFAENEKVGRHYLEQLSGYRIDGKPVADDLEPMARMKIEGGLDDFIAEWQEALAGFEAGGNAAMIARARDEIAKAERVKNSDVTKAGILYEVEIDVEPHQLLDYDAKLRDQPQHHDKLRAIAAKYGIENIDDVLLTERGGWFYDELAMRTSDSRALDDEGFAVEYSPDRASQALKDAGIFGIRYFDEGSRVKGKGTRNIVILDDSLVKITHKNGEPVTAAERQSVVDEMFSLRQSPDQPRTATEVKAFHGTPRGAIERFRAEMASGVHDGAMFFTSHPDGTSPYTGETYIDDIFYGEMRSTVYPTFVETKGFKEIDWKGQTHNDGVGPAGGNLNTEMALAKREGYPGLTVKNIDEAGGVQDWFIAWGEGTVRSALSEAQMLSMGRDAQALGQTNPDAKIISLGARAIEAEARATGKSEEKITIETARHEALEFFLAKGFIQPKEWATLVDVALEESWVEAVGVREPYTAQFGEPPVPSGKVRVYHSGSVGDGEFGRWVSTIREYAKNYRADRPLHWLDLDRGDPRLNNPDYPDQGIDQGFTFNFELTPKEATKLRPIMDAAQLEDLILKESIMVKYGEYEQGNYKPKGIVAKVFKRIKDFLDRLRNRLKEQGFQRWEDIFQKMDAGEMRQRYEARFGAPAAESKSRIASKAVPAGGRIAAMAAKKDSFDRVNDQLEAIFDRWTDPLEGVPGRWDNRDVYDMPALRALPKLIAADIARIAPIDARLDEIERTKDGMDDSQMAAYDALTDEAESLANEAGEIYEKWGASDSVESLQARQKRLLGDLKKAEALVPQFDELNVDEDDDAGAGEQRPRIATMTLPGLVPNLPLSPTPAGPTPGRAASAPGSLVDIQRNLRRKLGLTVASGRLDPAAARAAGQAGGKVMGQFDRQTEVIRLRTLQDIDTEAHEVAHALENRYTGLANLQQAHAQELDGVANLTGQSGLSEGFAEFFRLYLTNPPAADAHAPRFRAAFENFIETEDAQVLQDIQEIQAQYQQWRDASSAGRITAAVKSGVPDGTWEKIRAEYDRGGLTRVGGMFWAYLEQVYKSRIDRTNPIRVLVERIARQAEAVNQDIDLSAWRNPQAQARKIPAADGIAYMDITRGVGWENAAGRGSISLRDALATAFGGTGYEHWTPQQRDDFGAYLIARRGRWLWQRHDMDPARNRGRMASPPQNPQSGDWYFDTMARQRRVYLRGRWEGELTRAPDKHTRADHEQAVADLEAANPQFAVAAQMIYQFNRDLALKRFQAGLDSQEEFDYKNGATDYVPWFRDMTDAIFAGTGVSGRKVQGKFKIRGSYRDFINPVEGIIRQVYDTNREVAANKPKLLLAQLADSVQGAGKFAEIIPATRMASQEVRVRDALAQAAKAEGLPPEDAKDMIAAVAAMIGDDAVATLFRSEQAGDGRDAILHYMDGGELKMLQIHDDERGIARDILGFFEMLRGTPASDSFFNMITAAVRVPQRAITASVGFLWRNLIRDSMQASILQAGYFPIVSNIRTVASNRARAARGEESWGELLTRHGGIMGGFNRTDIQQARAGRVLDLRSDSVTLRPWEKQFWKQTVNPWHEDFWKWAEWSEANARQTIARISFDRAIKDVKNRYPTMPADQQDFVAMESAVHRSRDYLDYSRAGDAPSQMAINRFFMFFSPYLQGGDKSINALFLAKDNEGRFATAQLFRKKIAPLFNDNMQFKNLTKSEKDALKDALRAWTTIAILAHVHLLMEVFFNDPEELEDKSKLERATSVSFTINGVDYRIPRGFDILNLVSNGVRATYDSWWREDPTARKQFLETQMITQLPPLSNPILDLYIGWKHGKNNFFNSDIEQKHMAAMLPEDRYTAYTSGLARKLGEATGVSPAMVEYTMNTMGADWSRDILRAYDVFDPNRPALRWQEYPFLRAARGLRGSRGSEEFWDLMGADGSFTQPANSYKDGPNKGWTREDYRKFFDRRLKDDDAKAYAIMAKHYSAEQRRLHPMERAREMASGASAVMRDVASNRIKVPVTGKIDRKVEASREVRAQAIEILGEINRREYRNALIALKRPGYENREPQPVKPYLEELKTISPEIHKALIGEITNSSGPKVYDYDKVREAWPDIRRRILATEKRERIIETQGDVEFSDLIGRAQGPKAAGIR